MRDIIYRGKTKDGEWVYGGVVIYEKDAFIITEEDISWSIMGDRGDYDGCITPVLPETVGQYTGLLDKDGKKVFEGDIVMFNRGRNLPNTIQRHLQVFFDDRNAQFTCFRGPYATLQKEQMSECEVIGNIHDNPELLEVK